MKSVLTAKHYHNSCSGFIRNHKKKFIVDRSKKLGSILVNEIILNELIWFLEKTFKKNDNFCLLDAGAGTKPYSLVYKKYFSSCVSFDVTSSPHDISSVNLISSCLCLPFKKEQFDCILCTEVLEHVPEPVSVLKEFNRVLKPGGRIFLTTPFLVPVHETPWDFFRFTPYALSDMSAKANLRVEEISSKGEYFAFAL